MNQLLPKPFEAEVYTFAKENLKIGDYIYRVDEEGNKKIIEVEFKDLIFFDSISFNNEHFPIPLDDYWLEKFGYEILENRATYNIKHPLFKGEVLELEMVDDGCGNHVWLYRFFNLTWHVRFVHQLSKMANIHLDWLRNKRNDQHS